MESEFIKGLLAGGIIVVAELLRWGAPLQLIMCVVLLAFHEKALQSEDCF